MGLAFDGTQGADTFSISPIAGLAVNRTSIAMACWVRNAAVAGSTLLFALWKKSSFEKFHIEIQTNSVPRAVYEYSSGVTETVNASSTVSASWKPCMIRISGSSGTFTKMEIWFGAAQTTPDSATISRSNVSAQLDRIIVGDGDSSDVGELIIWGDQNDTQAQEAWDSFKTGALPENVDSARQVTGATLVDATSPSLTLYNSLGSLSTYGGAVATSSTHPITRGTNATASGSTVSAAASLVAGSAAGGTGATAAGITLSAAASLIAGSASVGTSATASGATLAAAAALLAGTAAGNNNATLNFQGAGMEFGARTGLGIGTFALENGKSYRYTVHADGLVLGAPIITSSAITLDSAGKLPNLTHALLFSGLDYRVCAIRQSDGEASTPFRMRAQA